MNNVPSRKRTSGSKILKGLTPEGTEFYYSRKPHARQPDFDDSKAKPKIAKARVVTTKKK